MSQRSNPKFIPSQSQTVLDENKHKMKFRNEKVSSMYPNRDEEEIECYLCLESIDKVLGYYNCPICKLDMCLECSQARDRNDFEMAENPLLLPTPFADLNQSNYMMNRTLNKSLITKEFNKEIQSVSQINLRVGNTLINPRLFDYELQTLDLSQTAFDKIKKNLFADAEQEIKFVPRSGNRIDRKIGKIMKLMKVNDVPIVAIRDNLYFIGLYKVLVEMQADYLMVKVNENKFDRFSEYIKDNREYITNMLALLSIKNQNASIVEITNSILRGQEIQGLNSSFMSNLGQSIIRNRDQSIGSIRNSVIMEDYTQRDMPGS